MDKSARIWNNWEEVLEFTKTTEDGLVPGRVVDSMFPPLEGSDAYGIPLERCMRVYGHMQDTGAFFITVLRKKADFKAKPESPGPNEVILKAQAEASKRPRDEDDDDEKEAKKQKVEETTNGHATVASVSVPADADTVLLDADAADAEEAPPEGPAVTAQETAAKKDDTVPGVTNADNSVEQPATETSTPAAQTPGSGIIQQETRKPNGAYEEPFKYLSPEHEVIKDITAFYGISDRFPSDRYIVRNATGQPAKAIYYSSALVRDILVMNEGRGVKFVHGGVKMFVKQDAPSADVCR